MKIRQRAQEVFDNRWNHWYEYFTEDDLDGQAVVKNWKWVCKIYRAF